MYLFLGWCCAGRVQNVLCFFMVRRSRVLLYSIYDTAGKGWNTPAGKQRD